VTFSNASEVELKNLNVKVGRLIFNARKVVQLAEEKKEGNIVDEELKDLFSRLQKIYRRVNMSVSTCLSIVLETLLI
jgi:hypothetical protein